MKTINWSPSLELLFALFFFLCITPRDREKLKEEVKSTMADDWKAITDAADKLKEASDLQGDYKVLNDAFVAGNQHPQILWRLARACYDLAHETTEKEKRQELVDRGLTLIKKSVEEDPNNFASQKWMGILISATKEFVSTKETIANAFIIRDHFKKAVELNPKDATALHCLGKWCWSVLQISWIERQAASLLFATPPTSTYDECREYLLASHNVEPTIHNCVSLGDLYYQEKNWTEAKKWFELAQTLPVKTERQKRESEDAKKKAASC